MEHHGAARYSCGQDEKGNDSKMSGTVADLGPVLVLFSRPHVRGLTGYIMHHVSHGCQPDACRINSHFPVTNEENT
jgi:hypothetical protein